MRTVVMLLPVSRENPAAALHHRGAEGHVVLRPLAPTDAEEMTRAVEESLPELRRFMPWAHLPITLEGQLARLKTLAADYAAGRSLGMGLFDARTGTMLVNISLEPRVPLNPAGWEIGYWTRSGLAGRGMCTLAVRMITLYAFDLLGSDRVQILTHRENVASARVAEKCGFRLEAELENVVAAPAADHVRAGLSADPITLSWVMVPRTYALVPWAATLRRGMVVENLLGQAITGWC